jgi:predicted lipoprotein with Yx(FWY)xxD motif
MGIGQRYPRHQEVTMRNSFTLGAAAAALALLAGCGSSSNKTASTTTTAASATGTPASSASKSPYGPGSAGGASASTGAGAVTVTSKPSKVGTVLAAGPKKMSVYLFEADAGAQSACSGACAGVWPPVTTSGTAKASGAALAADLGTIMRSDGTKQVTYKGHPLYFFAKDKDDGDSYGQGIKSFGAAWYVLAPSGKKIDNS